MIRSIKASAYFILSLTIVACSANGIGHEPLPDILDRETPLHFGLYVTPDPEENPIDPPERFAGYHTAVDFEVDASELDADVPVFAACDGAVLQSGYAEGYGGLLIHSCVLDGEDVTVLYGHLAVDSLRRKGDKVIAGDQIGILGEERSTDTDGTRKHLHFAIHKGTEIVTLGYVQTPEELDQFLDPETILFGKRRNTPTIYRDE